MNKNMSLLRIKKAIAKDKYHRQIVDILNRYAVCDFAGIPDFIGSTEVCTVHCALMNAEELARKIEEALC